MMINTNQAQQSENVIMLRRYIITEAWYIWPSWKYLRFTQACFLFSSKCENIRWFDFVSRVHINAYIILKTSIENENFQLVDLEFFLRSMFFVKSEQRSS